MALRGSSRGRRSSPPALAVMAKLIRIKFGDIETVPTAPGFYEIHSNNGVPLKVGIGANLRRRLRQHRESRQKYLKLKPGGCWSNPDHVMSKRSILAKHLYFEEPKKNYDLKTENGRREFLSKECYIFFRVTISRAEARELEKISEREGRFRYMGRVSARVEQDQMTANKPIEPTR